MTSMLTPEPEKQLVCTGAARRTLVMRISKAATHDRSQMVLGGTTNKMCAPRGAPGERFGARRWHSR